MRYYIIAGEASGDLLASQLMRGLHAADPSCDIRFWGGDAMAAAGGTCVRHYRETAVMGFVEILSKARRILDNLAFCKRDLLSWRPDAVILVDYPGFNLRIARFARKHGFKVFYYIAPKAWAHKAWRVRNLRRDVDVLYCIFPFELDWFRARGLAPRYEGNPLPGIIGPRPYRPQHRIALLPGSREAELKFLLPRFAELEKRLAADSRFSSYRLTVAGAPSMRPETYRKYLPADSAVEVVFGETYDILASADAAVISSGTASLEAALIGTPQLVCYGFNRLTWMIARRVVKVPFISLANLTLGRQIFPELLQDDASPDRIFTELENLLTNEELRTRMMRDYGALRTLLGDGDPSARTAQNMYEETARL